MTKLVTAQPENTYRIAELMEKCGVSRVTINTWLREGNVLTYKATNRQHFVDKESFDVFFANRYAHLLGENHD